MLFSFLGVVFVIFVSYLIAKNSDNLFGIADYFANIFKNVLDGYSLQTFSNMEELETILSGLEINSVLLSILRFFISNITFEGEFTLGELLSPFLSTLVYKIVVFIVAFVIILVGLRIVSLFFNFLIKKTGLSPVNRFLGMLLGFVKGVLVASVVYLAFSTLAGFGLSEWLSNFVNAGVLSKFVYENHIIKLFEGLYSIFS